MTPQIHSMLKQFVLVGVVEIADGRIEVLNDAEFPQHQVEAIVTFQQVE